MLPALTVTVAPPAATPQGLSALTIDDVKQWYKTVYKPAGAVLDARIPLASLPWTEPHNHANAACAALLAYGLLKATGSPLIEPPPCSSATNSDVHPSSAPRRQ